ncbi:hypothetical protein Vadar_025182 [Vaccinium darrowii]|uniref:Uncharacterized protein n=1 Tax=Vaccinium darrowii TaxID=229202 RepID=A0ACB7ZE74_9ERIC|nr:hypothetical protein Vadar_025182 [Vaccinium darrowii]
MSGSGVVTVYGNGAITETTAKKSPFSVKVGLAQMLRGGVIMDVVNAEQARIAEEAGACAVMALERVPADIRAQGGVARMSDPQLIKEIKQAVTIPVMAKARIGHFVEAQILEALGIDYIDESEVLTPADDENHINKHNFRIPFVCGCRNLGEALRRIREGAAMIRTKGEAGTGNIIEAVRHVRSVMGDIRVLRNMDDDEVFSFAKKIAAPYDLVMQTKQLGRLPVVHFAAGGVATPADAALMMQLGCDGVFVGSGVFKSGDPARRARAIVQAVTHYSDPDVLAEVSCGLGEAMVGINLNDDKVERRKKTLRPHVSISTPKYEANPSAPCIYLHSHVYIHHLKPKLQEEEEEKKKKKNSSSSSKLSVSFFMERASKQYYRFCFCFNRMFRQKAVEPPHDVKALFETYSENGTMSVDHLLWFLSEFQLEEKATKEDAQAILNSLKHLNIFQRKGLHLEAFFKHLFSDNNPPLSPSLGVHHDMKAPLAHYFLYTGHNSYLTGNQLSSDCSEEPIVKALKRGVRVIELDLWPNSTRDGVDVRHGGTLTTPVELSKCLFAIKDHAFSASEYPVIITFEDHLTPSLQAKVANMVIETFGPTLFRPESELKELPSPESLKSKILISTKPPKEYLESHVKQKGNPHKAKGSAVNDEIEEDDEDESEEEEDIRAEYRSLIAIHAGKLKGGMDNWFSDDTDRVRRVSLSEQELENAVRTHATDIVRFTQRNLLRVYPKGIRFDSSNYNPYIGWAHGAQMVAYNMQGYGKNLWIMHGMFTANGGCGYVKKPDFLLDGYDIFDPEEELPVKKTLKVKVYSGEGWHSDFPRTYFDLYSPPDFYTRVGIAGVPRDTVMRRTRAIEDQWVPVWNEEFEFPLTVPELAVLRIEVMEYDTTGKPDFGGQTCLPISELRSGIRAVPLHNRRGEKYKSVKLLMQFKFV